MFVTEDKNMEHMLFYPLVNATHSKNTYNSNENDSLKQLYVKASYYTSNINGDIYINVVYAVFCLLGIIGNGLVIWFAIFRMKKTVNVLWYLSLAVADFSFSFCCLLDNTGVFFVTDWSLSDIICKLNNVFVYINMVVSVLQVTVISVDRCICVVFPVWCHNHRRPRLAFIIVLIIWIISIAVVIPYIINTGTTDMDYNTVCISKLDESSVIRMRSLELIFLFFLPFIIIVFCYIVIVLHLSRKRIFASSRTLKTTVAVITAFFICWLPNHLFSLLLMTDDSMFGFYVYYYGSVVVIFLMVFNSCINPILYVFIGRDFKKKFCGSFQTKLEKAFIEDHQSERSTAPQWSHQDGTEEVVIG